MSVHLKTILVAGCLFMSSNAYAQIQGTDDFRVNVETGVEDTRFESDRMDLTNTEDPKPSAKAPGILGSQPNPERFKLLETGALENSLPEPVSNRRRARQSNALIQSTSAPLLATPSVDDVVDESEAGGGLFWAIILGIGLVFIVLLLLLKGGGGDDNDANKKRRVEIR